MIPPPFYSTNLEETVSEEDAHASALKNAKMIGMQPVQQSIFLVVIYFMLRPGAVSLYSIYMVINQVQGAITSALSFKKAFRYVQLPTKEILPYILMFVGINIGKSLFILGRLYQALSSVSGATPPALSAVPFGSK